MERGVVSPKERSNNPAIICVNFHELNFNSLPLQMGEGPRCTTYSKSHPKRGVKTPSNTIKLGLKMQTKCSTKQTKDQWANGTSAPFITLLNKFFLTYLAGGCVLFHGFTPTKVG